MSTTEHLGLAFLIALVGIVLTVALFMLRGKIGPKGGRFASTALSLSLLAGVVWLAHHYLPWDTIAAFLGDLLQGAGVPPYLSWLADAQHLKYVLLGVGGLIGALILLRGIRGGGATRPQSSWQSPFTSSPMGTSSNTWLILPALIAVPVLGYLMRPQDPFGWLTDYTAPLAAFGAGLLLWWGGMRAYRASGGGGSMPAFLCFGMAFVFLVATPILLFRAAETAGKAQTAAVAGAMPQPTPPTAENRCESGVYERLRDVDSLTVCSDTVDYEMAVPANSNEYRLWFDPGPKTNITALLSGPCEGVDVVYFLTNGATQTFRWPERPLATVSGWKAVTWTGANEPGCKVHLSFN